MAKKETVAKTTKSVTKKSTTDKIVAPEVIVPEELLEGSNAPAEEVVETIIDTTNIEEEIKEAEAEFDAAVEIAKGIATEIAEELKKPIVIPKYKEANKGNSNANFPTGKQQKAKASKPDKDDPAAKYPEHIRNLSAILRNNSEIRRFTSLAILNYLVQKGEIRVKKTRYVSFLYNKFQVKYDGLIREYNYTEPFFLNALVAAHASFAAASQRTIDIFTKTELDLNIQTAVSQSEVEDMTIYPES